MTNLDRCLAYLAKLPPAVSGSGGHNATLRAACECVRFGLTDAEAMQALTAYNRRCQPAWSERELAHKLASARRLAAGESGTKGRPAATRKPPASSFDIAELEAALIARGIDPRNGPGTAPKSDGTASVAINEKPVASNANEGIPASIREFAEWAGATIEVLP